MLTLGLWARSRVLHHFIRPTRGCVCIAPSLWPSEQRVSKCIDLVLTVRSQIKDFVLLSEEFIFIQINAFTDAKKDSICIVNTNEVCRRQRKCLKVVLRFWKVEGTDGPATWHPVWHWLAACLQSQYALQAPGCQVVNFLRVTILWKSLVETQSRSKGGIVKYTAALGAMLA